MCMYSDDIFSIITGYHGDDSYMYLATLSRHHRGKRSGHRHLHGVGTAPKRRRVHRTHPIRTSLYHAAGSSSRLQELQEGAEVNVKTVASMIGSCAKKGDVESVKRIDELAPTIGIRIGGLRCPETMKAAALSRNTRAMEWCMKRGFCMNGDVLAAAASTGRLDTVKWLIDRKCKFDNIVIE